ncbi:hypothetical protein AVEN_196597-1 [Araneus ventricosus]|uniref:Endonuclease/exonuclease/phosphatase domain-containing protein n=1 Tax=Araneus ventricosus TaxID=182803 RepID=A0A4Y2GRB6_ARAVE|nr:hypothetical protein AVEN_196597-1 [Araneus ventricosus]
MTKRAHSDPDEQAARPNKTSRKLNLFIKDIGDAEKAKIAIAHAAKQVKGVTDTETEQIDSSSGGLLIGINKKFSPHLVQLHLPPSEVEVQAVRIVIESKYILIINIYYSHGNFEPSFLENLYESISPPFIIVGDFNIHHQILGSLRTSKSANVVLDWISTHNMCILNTSDPTPDSKESLSERLWKPCRRQG